MPDRDGLGVQFDQIGRDKVVSVADAVAQSLRDAIVSGRLPAGERILQDQVASDLGVSRQPVREAIKRLQSEGLVIELTNRRVIVREYTFADICENYMLRRVLESEAARLAAVTSTDLDVAELADINSALRLAARAKDRNGLLELNKRFHRVIRGASRYPTLEALINSLWLGRTIVTPLSVPGRIQRSIQEHDTIVEALRARDGEAASRAMADHINQACLDFLASSELSPDDEREVSRLRLPSSRMKLARTK